jgi:uncharacterized protein (TIGR02231 family)
MFRSSRLVMGMFLATSVLLVSGVHAEVIDVTSDIAQATVYPSSARVTRVVKVSLKEGAQTIKFKGVNSGFDENSLSVAGKGSASVKILGAGIKTEFLKESSDDRVRELEAKIQTINDEISVLNGEGAVLEEKKAFLNSVRLFNGGQLPKDMVTKVPTADELKATLAFLEEGSKAYNEGAWAIRLKGREKDKTKEVLQQELNQLRSATGRQEQSLAVDVECEKAGDLTLEISYTVMNVSWYPIYDARVEFEKGKAILSSFAVVQQTTGEDWNNVQLTLSTSKPSVGGRMPELSSWQIRPMVQMHRNDGGARNMFGGAVMSKAAVMMDSAVMLAEEAPAQRMAPRKAETAYAVAETSGVSLVYKTGRPVTIKSDGSEARVPLNVQTLDAVFQYAVTPKLSSYAYLKSTVTNSATEQLMAGRVNIFLDGTFVGNSDIQKTIAPAEPFDLYLGVDEGVVIKRQLVEEKSDDTLIGNIPSGTKKISYVYKITLENFKPRPIVVDLFDQIPVAQDDKIKVVKVTPSIKPNAENYKDRQGVYLWTMTLQPKEKKEITLSYVVEYPRDMNVDGL